MSGIEVLGQILYKSSSTLRMNEKYSEPLKTSEQVSKLVSNRSESEIRNITLRPKSSSYNIDDILKKRQVKEETARSEVNRNDGTHE